MMLVLTPEERFQIQTALTERIRMLEKLADEHKKDGLTAIEYQLRLDANEAKHARNTIQCL
jgi:flagellar motor component MotA